MLVFIVASFESVMRLAAKLILLYLVGLLLIVGLFAYLTIRQGQQLAIVEHQRHASDLAATIEPSLKEAIKEDDELAVQKIVTRSTRQVRHMSVRWVRLDASGEGRPSVPLEMIIAKQELTTISMPDPSGQDVLYTYVPIESEEGAEEKDAGRIEVSAPNHRSEEQLKRSIVTSLLTLLGVATLSGIVILVGGVVMVGKPLEELIDKVHRAGRGDFDEPLKLKSTDELGRLAGALNEMCDQLSGQRQQLESETASRISTLEQLRHSDRLNTVGRMAAGIAHEIGTPLNVVSGRAELIAGGQLSEGATRESALAIKSEAQRITKIIRELLDFARQSTPHPARRPLNDVIESTAGLMKPLAAKHGVDLQVQLPEQPLLCDFDSGQIQQVLTNLMVNAIQSTDRNGQVTIDLSEVITRAPDSPHDPPAPYRRIEIRDNGSGIAADDLQHIFEPFFTTKDVGDGTGLGLSISHGIVREHGGWIAVESELGQGSCFSVYLPSTVAEGSGDE